MDTGMDFTGKVALVTGAGRGIGKGVALRLARHGADVIVNDLLAETAERTAQEVQALGRQAYAVAGDVSSSRSVDEIVEKGLQRFGHIDILVNNAGISLYRPILECSEEDWDRHIDVMAKGTFLLMRKVAPGMIARKWGRIVNLGSYVAQLNCVTKYFGPYCAAKFAIIGLTQVAAQEWAPYVTVNAVGPGDVETEMMELEWQQEGAKRNVPPADVKEEYRKRLILQRLEAPDDIAKAVVFLCSTYADQVTGSHLIVSGGLPFTVK
ncbi:MAG: SDR family NAD(P)-dependent oxidoreductase [Anaerolineales bacterium]|nr:SDR family NAD(P)-dependent oxidoreductase [Anaerolineales bacterium]